MFVHSFLVALVAIVPSLVSAAPVVTPTSSAAPTPTAGLCYGGSAPKSTTTTKNGAVFGLCPGNDFYGGDFTSRLLTNDADCIEACSKIDGCVAAAFANNKCWIKNVRNTASVNANVDAIYMISPGTIATSTSTAATVTGTGLCSGGTAPQSTKVASNGDVYGICPKNDFHGGDMQAPFSATDIGVCVNACSAKTGCVAVAFEFNNCYLKNVQNSASSILFVEAAYKISSANTIVGASCQQVTAGFLCPSLEVNFQSGGKSVCKVTQALAAMTCATVDTILDVAKLGV